MKTIESWKKNVHWKRIDKRKHFFLQKIASRSDYTQKTQRDSNRKKRQLMTRSQSRSLFSTRKKSLQKTSDKKKRTQHNSKRLKHVSARNSKPKKCKKNLNVDGRFLKHILTKTKILKFLKQEVQGHNVQKWKTKTLAKVTHIKILAHSRRSSEVSFKSQEFTEGTVKLKAGS